MQNLWNNLMGAGEAAEPTSNRPVVGVIAVVWRAGQVLLVRRRNAPSRGLWAFPGGRLEHGETIVAGALRELAEETGLRARSGRVLTAFDAFTEVAGDLPRGHFVLIAVLAEDVTGEPAAADDAAAVGWFPADALPAPAVPDLERIARLSLDALT